MYQKRAEKIVNKLEPIVFIVVLLQSMAQTPKALFSIEDIKNKITNEINLEENIQKTKEHLENIQNWG